MTFEEALTGWLPGQRWFAGKGAPIDHLAIAADTVLVEGDPALRHLIVAVSQATGTDRYPVFYLLHGAGDCDDSWTSVGRANDILDNLIAAKKAVPMRSLGVFAPMASQSP